ncbi:MAG: NADH-quinone oxidoreductase subunit H [Kosmotoga sp.]|nr:MAG: NADH-quinone oxidoreductase subunit H [Kosmotoga sp.]
MIVFYTLVFPGGLFALVAGLLGWWVERKVSAKVQHRIGPPWNQNFYDVFKLLGKESIIPKESSSFLYIASPIIAFSAILALSVVVGVPIFLGSIFAGDIILVIYILAIISAAIFLGAGSSSNVFASIGAGRELKMLLADELVFVMIILIPIIKSGFVFNLKEIFEGTPAIFSVSGIIAYLLGLITIQAKLAIQPFDLPEAETELAGGVEIEYSGVLLAIWKLTKGVQFFVLPLLLSALFFGIPSGLSLMRYIWIAIFYVVTLVILIVLKNVNPRITINSMLNFFWKIMAPLALVAVVLALLGV